MCRNSGLYFNKEEREVERMKFNKKGWDLFDKWEQKYYEENDRLGGDSVNKDFVEGWSIIENEDFVKTLDDAVGLLVFGYDDNAISVVDEWIENDEEEDTYLGFKLGDIKRKLKDYYVKD